MSRWRRPATAGAALVAGLAMAACSSSGSGKSGKSGNSEVVFGTVGTYSGALGSNSAGIPPVTKAWVATVNAAGGLNGHKVRLIVKDTGGATGANITAVKELVEQDHVAAIFDFDTVDTAWLAYAEQKKVPVIAYTSSPQAQTYPNVFGVSESSVALTYQLPALAKTVGTKYGVLYCSETPGCGQAATILGSFAKSMGMTVPVSVKVSASSPDFTAVCQNLKNAGVQSYTVFGPTATLKKVADQCYQQGLRATLVQNGTQADPSWKTDPALNGMILSDTSAPFFSTATPAHVAYRDALKKYASNVPNSNLDNSYSEGAWLQGKLVEAAAKNVNGDITAASLTQGLYALKKETLGGLIEPVTYTPGKPTILTCYYRWTVENGQYTAPNGDKFECVPKAVVQQMLDKTK